MREARMYSFSACVFQSASDFRQRSAGVAHVVDDQTTAATNVANHVHNLGHIGLFASLVAKSKFGVEPLGVSSGAFGAAGIGSHHRQIRKVVLLIVADKNR